MAENAAHLPAQPSRAGQNVFNAALSSTAQITRPEAEHMSLPDLHGTELWQGAGGEAATQQSAQVCTALP